MFVGGWGVERDEKTSSFIHSPACEAGLSPCFFNFAGNATCSASPDGLTASRRYIVGGG